MTKVVIEPGICGFTTNVEALANDDDELTLTVETSCPNVTAMMGEMGTEFEAFDLCLKKPGQDPFHEWIADHKYPVHAACPVVAGILKCAEAEAGLALKRDASITFVE